MRRSRQPRDPDGASSDNRRAHRYRVSIYSVRLAEAVGLDAQAIQAPIKGAFLHDVGKIGVPDHILLKPGKLNDEEYAEMEKHVAHGLDIVHRAAWLADAEAVVGYHHEKYGGGGYDGQLKTDAIPLIARIFVIADVFDALTSRRPYKPPLVDNLLDRNVRPSAPNRVWAADLTYVWADLFEYIEVFYNRSRRHSTLKSRSPTQFPQDWTSAQPGQNVAA